MDWYIFVHIISTPHSVIRDDVSYSDQVTIFCTGRYFKNNFSNIKVFPRYLKILVYAFGD